MIYNIASCLPSLPSINQIQRGARLLVITGLFLYAISELPTVYAFTCEEKESICVKHCLGGGRSSEAAACLIGYNLGYLAFVALRGS